MPLSPLGFTVAKSDGEVGLGALTPASGLGCRDVGRGNGSTITTEMVGLTVGGSTRGVKVTVDTSLPVEGL